MNSGHSFTEGMDMVKPRFLISFRYSNAPHYRPEKPYLVPLNTEAHFFRSRYYGINGILFNHDCQ